MTKHLIRAAAIAALVVGSGCVELADEELADEDLETVEQDLSVYDWSPRTWVYQFTYRGAQIATLGTTMYMVHSGGCGAWSCGGDSPSRDLWWTYRDTTGTWLDDVKIPSQRSAHKVSLAAFNGYLYMLHSGSTDGNTQVWLSRFNPSTRLWSANFQLGYSSRGGPPAIAAYGGRLHLVGVDPASMKLWHATMTTGEVFSPAMPMEGHYSASRVSLAVFQGRLYMAHRSGAETAVVYNSFDGSSWGLDRTINVGPNGGPIGATEPVIAAYNDHLHLIHRRPGSTPVWWTYFDGSAWPTELTIGDSTYDPSLALGSTGLVLATTADYLWNGIVEKRQPGIQTYSEPPTGRGDDTGFPP